MLDFDLMLRHVGEFGLYQKLLFAFQAPFCMFVTFVLFGHLFLTLSPSVYWCQDHFECIHDQSFRNMNDELRRNISTPFFNGGFECRFNEMNATFIASIARWTMDSCTAGANCNYDTNMSASQIQMSIAQMRMKRRTYFNTNLVPQFAPSKRTTTTVPTTTMATTTTGKPISITVPGNAVPDLTPATTISSLLPTTMSSRQMTDDTTTGFCNQEIKCPNNKLNVTFRVNSTVTIRRDGPGRVRTCTVNRCKEVRWNRTSNRIGTPYPTIVTEGEWWCTADLYVSSSQSIFFLGAIVGGFVIGYIADTVGRVPALVIANLLGAIGGALSVATRNFWFFMFCRFVTGMAFDNCFTMMYILVLEFSGPRYRTLVANLSIAIFYTIGTLILPLLAVSINNWQIYGLVISLPMFSGLLALFIVPESARWLLSKGRSAEATDILRSFAKVNRKQVDERIFIEFEQNARELYEQLSTDEEEVSIFDVFRTPRLRRTFILLTVIWALIAFVYDSHSRNILNLANEQWSIFTMFTIASMTEFPADMFLIFTLDILGRRWLSFGALVLSGTFSIIAATVPVALARSVGLIFAMLSRFCVNVAFNVGLQYAAELLPTVIRAQGVNAIHIMGYLASVASPFLAMLGRTSVPMSLLILGGCAIFAGVLCLFLSETLGEELPNTLEDAEAFGLGQSFWNCPACGTGGARRDDENKIIADSNAYIPSPVQLRNSMLTSRRGETYRSSIISSSSSTQYSQYSTSKYKFSIPMKPVSDETTKLVRQ